MSRRIRLRSIVAILIAGLLSGFFYFNHPSRRGREAELKEDLRAMREAIDAYTLDSRPAPQSLKDLVTGHYLKTIPTAHKPAF